MAEIDFTTVLVDTKGEPIVTNDGKTPLTLGGACETALDMGIAADANEGLSPKLKRGKLIETIVKAVKEATPITLTAEDVALIKARVALVFTAASVVLQISRLLDPATE